MTRRQVGGGGLALLMLAIGIWVLLPKHSAAPAKDSASVVTESKAREAPAVPVLSTGSKTTAPSDSDLWTRPAAKVAARNARRSGFAWILRQLGATEQQLNRLADHDIAGVIAELKQKALAGDAASINILGEIALQNCQGRDDATLDSFLASQVRDVQAVPGIDPPWFSAVIRDEVAFDKEFNAACAQVDVDGVMSQVKMSAARGDGASLWLMYRDSNNMAEMQELLREAAAAGFPQAQFELAWAIIGKQEGAQGTKAGSMTVGDALRASQTQLPRSEMQLAICEYYGCDGVAVDINAAVKHAQEAAERGAIDAILDLGRHLPAGQLNPDEVTAWGLVQASMKQAGCGGSGFNIREMKAIASALGANNISPQARLLAEQYWRDYGTQMMSNTGCTS